MATIKKYVYLFEEGNAKMKSLLGGKGANLAEMTKIGLPVPPGFTITTECCIDYNNLGKEFPEGLEPVILDSVKTLEKKIGKSFGGEDAPLLFSVRSGAPISMPGMMDTILNLGLNDKTVLGHARATNNERFAWDCYRRLIQMFGNVVMGLEHRQFEEILEHHKEKAGVHYDYEMNTATLQGIVEDYKALVKRSTGRDFPQDPRDQLIMAVRAVFDSWNNPRAIVYRKINKIPDSLGTAVNVQTMVFGNTGNDSGTGVIFTRNPNTGAQEFYGEYLPNAQGEDVVAGIRTPKQIAELHTEMPAVYDQLYNVCMLLESHYAEMQDIEFTFERGKLYMLQCRSGKRTAAAAMKIAVDLVAEGKIDKPEALLRVAPDQVEKLLHRGVDPKAKLNVLATGLPASPGAAVGAAVFSADDAERLGQEGQKVVLVRPETTPDDIHGIVEAQGILTSRGGMTCHAAIVARGMGKPCVVGCEALRIDLDRKQFTVGDVTIKEGDLIAVDGATGRVILGSVPLVDPEISPEFKKLLEWADETRTLGVEANADTPEDARKAREFGATGVGLCRTEHMFMAQDRLPVVQQMILAETLDERKAALSKLLPMQQGDFEGILEAMDGFPVTIRLLDPPLHEFLPNQMELTVDVAVLRERIATAGKTGANAGVLQKELDEKEAMLRKVRALAEFNPMLGFRGCRLGLVYPEIYEMQARAIFQATVALKKRGLHPKVEVMIPLVGHTNELTRMKELVKGTAEAVMQETGVTFEWKYGTMIEVPRGALTADELGKDAEFFSFGTNDLTQTTFGFSRDDAEGKFLAHYVEKKILPENPFMSLDQGGVGKLIQMAVNAGRGANPNLKVGICGEHGGDPASIEFCYNAGLNYVSCSPFRVPIARLAAAQARLKKERAK